MKKKCKNNRCLWAGELTPERTGRGANGVEVCGLCGEAVTSEHEVGATTRKEKETADGGTVRVERHG